MQHYRLGDFWLALRPGRTCWYITWFDKATRQTRRISTSEQDFERAKLKLAEHALLRTALQDERLEEVPFLAVLHRYWERHAAALPSAGTAKVAIARWQEFAGEALCADITPGKQLEFVAWLMRGLPGRKRVTLQTAKRLLSVGMAALWYAHRTGELRYAPANARLEVPATVRSRVLSLDEGRALFSAASGPGREHLFRYLLLAFGTGGRPEAILDLTRAQLDTHERVIHLNPPGRAQNKKRRPSIPMAPRLVPLVKSWPEPHVITWKGRPLESARMGFKKLCADAGLRDVTPYTVRHTVATWLYSSGVPLDQCAAFLGHRAGGSVTTARYIHLAPTWMAEARDAVNRLLGELLGPAAVAARE